MAIQPRLARDQLDALKSMGFTHIIVIAKDVSVVIPGAVESAFSRKSDAIEEMERLNLIYGDDSHEMQEL